MPRPRTRPSTRNLRGNFQLPTAHFTGETVAWEPLGGNEDHASTRLIIPGEGQSVFPRRTLQILYSRESMHVSSSKKLARQSQVSFRLVRKGSRLEPAIREIVRQRVNC